MITDQALLRELKHTLEAEKEKLEGEIRQLSQPVSFGDDVESDFQGEEADEAEEFSTRMGEAVSLKERLNDINRALIKIENETYGICENCQKDIELDLLKQNPESRHCRTCKTEMQKNVGDSREEE